MSPARRKPRELGPTLLAEPGDPCPAPFAAQRHRFGIFTMRHLSVDYAKRLDQMSTVAMNDRHDIIQALGTNYTGSAIWERAHC